MAVGFLVGSICFVDESTAAAAFCAASYPRLLQRSDGSTVTQSCTGTGGGSSPNDGWVTFAIRERIFAASGAEISFTTAGSSAALTLCDTTKDYTGGMTLITVADAQTVAWGIIGAWIAAAAVVGFIRFLRA